MPKAVQSIDHAPSGFRVILETQATHGLGHSGYAKARRPIINQKLLNCGLVQHLLRSARIGSSQLIGFLRIHRIRLLLLRSAMFIPSVVCAPRMGGSIRVIIPSRKKPHKRVTEIFAANTPKRCSTMCSQRAWGCGSGLRLATAEDACGSVISSTL